MSDQSRMRRSLGIAADIASIVSAMLLSGLALIVGASAFARFGGGPNPIAAGGPPATGVATRGRESPVQPLTGVDTRVNETLVGSPGARVVVIEFTDYQCPYCGRYARDIHPQLKAEFVDTQRIAYMVRSFPLENPHPFAVRASEAAECAREQGKFWPMYHRLFADQKRLNETELAAHGATIGLKRAEYESCLKSGRSTVPRADRAEGIRLGVRSTPTFLIGVTDGSGTVQLRQKLVGALPYPAFKAAIEQVLTTPAAEQD